MADLRQRRGAPPAGTGVATPRGVKDLLATSGRDLKSVA